MMRLENIESRKHQEESPSWWAGSHSSGATIEPQKTAEENKKRKRKYRVRLRSRIRAVVRVRVIGIVRVESPKVQVFSLWSYSPLHDFPCGFFDCHRYLSCQPTVTFR